ncbi:hypothetical protein [Oceanisphaera sp. IT1-181]|uniref:hypothetical protein n=1 Tax=Oceanisphaera sp. IT1-181 TaxID=3081199 RepID=UPI0029CA9DEC|nr:hypothetical protein [Oceanisphaera sp. IT1-181]
MSYTNYHIKRNRQHAIILVDDKTTLPALFTAIYTVNSLSGKKFSTQRNSLISIRFFYKYWLAKHSETLDRFFYRNNYNINFITSEIDGFFDYLLSQQHRTDNDKVFPVSFMDAAISHVNKGTYSQHFRAVARFLHYLNERYMCLDYQNLSPAEADTIYESNKTRLQNKVRDFSRLEIAKNEPGARYKSINLQQLEKLNKMLLPSVPTFVDEETGEGFKAQDNPVNPFKSIFLQYRNYLIHKLIYNYSLRAGEIQLLTLNSFGESQPDSQGNTSYLMSICNLPDYINDPRNKPITLKTSSSTRVITLDSEDYNYMAIFVESYRNPLFEKKEVEDHGFLFTTARGKFKPISYDTIRLVYKTIDSKFIRLHPYYRVNNPLLNMVKLTPHVGRHTWAYSALEFIYNDLLNEELRLSKNYGINGRMKGLLDAAAEQLRALGGWSIGSRMPYKYAQRFLEKVANDSNLKRIRVPELSCESQSGTVQSNHFVDNGDFDEFI